MGKLTEDTRKQSPLHHPPFLRPIENKVAINGPPRTLPDVSKTVTVVNTRALWSFSIKETMRLCRAGSSPSPAAHITTPKIPIIVSASPFGERCVTYRQPKSQGSLLQR